MRRMQRKVNFTIISSNFFYQSFIQITRGIVKIFERCNESCNGFYQTNADCGEIAYYKIHRKKRHIQSIYEKHQAIFESVVILDSFTANISTILLLSSHQPSAGVLYRHLALIANISSSASSNMAAWITGIPINPARRMSLNARGSQASHTNVIKRVSREDIPKGIENTKENIEKKRREETRVCMYDRVPEATTWSSPRGLSQSPIDHGIQQVHDPMTLGRKAP